MFQILTPKLAKDELHKAGFDFRVSSDHKVFRAGLSIELIPGAKLMPTNRLVSTRSYAAIRGRIFTKRRKLIAYDSTSTGNVGGAGRNRTGE